MRLLLALICILSPLTLVAAELTAQQQRLARAITASLQKAGTGYAAGRHEVAGQQLRDAMKQLGQAMEIASPEFFDALQPTIRRIETAHTLLEFEGVSLPPFVKPERPDETASAEPAPRRRPRTRSAPPAPPSNPETAISFTKDVAPILSNRCGRCHISDSKGRFNMSTFAALMKGPPEGVVVFAGDTVGSRLITTIETGDMPRGGGKVTAEELTTLKTWIEAGAKFDGEDPAAPIAVADQPTEPTQPMLQTRRASGRETVSFAADVAPLLVDNCNGCHIDAMQTRGGLRMDTFAQLLRGGDSGAVISPGAGEQSLLVKKLRGSVGQQMPAGGRSPLSEESIKLISTWIDEGATLDGASDNQPLRVMSLMAWAAAATDQEKSERRQQIADRNLKLVSASGPIESKTTEHFYVTGLASPGTLELVAELAEAQMKTARTVVSASPGEAYYKGRATIFVMPKRYDYSELAKMVEGREVPVSWTSHWKFDGIDAYVALVATEQDDEKVIADRLTAPLVALAVATRGLDVPRWLAEGAGIATANRSSNVRDRDARRAAEMKLSQAVAAMKDAKQFLDGNLSPEQIDLIGGAIVATMLDRQQRRNFDGLLRGLDGEKPFDQAFAQAFRATPQQYVTQWLRWVRGG